MVVTGGLVNVVVCSVVEPSSTELEMEYPSNPLSVPLHPPKISHCNIRRALESWSMVERLGITLRRG